MSMSTPSAGAAAIRVHKCSLKPIRRDLHAGGVVAGIEVAGGGFARSFAAIDIATTAGFSAHGKRA
jgi:hypothetical protein